jgi:hypothetical protein
MSITTETGDMFARNHGTKCSGCYFFAIVSFKANEPDEPVLGECHRYPPPHERKKFPGDPNLFPFINEDDWCGEWKQP